MKTRVGRQALALFGSVNRVYCIERQGGLVCLVSVSRSRSFDGGHRLINVFYNIMLILFENRVCNRGEMNLGDSGFDS